ncbi:MAG: DUF1294 domain-containing protein [Rhizomicrobium sp.]
MDMVLYVALYLVAVNVMAFGLYGVDKDRARAGEWRIRNSTLLLAGLIGGSIGAYAAQRVFRHKTRRRHFQIVFWTIVAIQILAAGAVAGRFLAAAP